MFSYPREFISIPSVALDREDEILDRMTQNLTPPERAALSILLEVVKGGFGETPDEDLDE